jgi:hypothetical protein
MSAPAEVATPSGDLVTASTSEIAVATRGEKYERLAFNFCKVATVVLLTGRYALVIASGAAAVLFLLSHRHGVHDSRCILKRPLLIATFWSVIFVVSVVFLVFPSLGDQVRGYLWSQLPFPRR